MIIRSCGLTMRLFEGLSSGSRIMNPSKNPTTASRNADCGIELKRIKTSVWQKRWRSSGRSWGIWVLTNEP